MPVAHRPALASGASVAALAAALATVAIGAGRAEAGRVVVLSVSGEGGGEYEDLLTDALSDEHRVIGARDFDAAASRAGVDGYEPEAIGQVARDLDADVVLDPLIAHDRRTNVLTIRIRDRDGALWKRMTVTIAARRLGRGGVRAVRERLLAEIDALIAQQGGRRDRGDDRGRDRDRVADRDRDRDRAATRDRVSDRGRTGGGARDDRRDRVAARDPDDDGDDPDLALDAENPLDHGDDRRRDDGRGDDRRDDDRDDRRDDDRDDAATDRRVRGRRAALDPRRAPFTVDGGPAAMNRNLTFSGQDFAQMPRGYHGAFVPAARITAELYPIGFANRASPAGGIGLYADYARVLKLTTRSTEAATVALPTSQVRWEVGLRFRYAFGSKPSYPSVALSVGYGRRAFIVDRTPLAGQTLDLPDVDYELITPGLSLRVPLGTARFALLAGGRFLAVRSAGAIQSPNEYGAATLTGLDAEAGFDVVITRQILLKARGELSRLGYDFTGNGAQTRNRDMDPSDQDIAGAADQWISASASVGFAF